MISANEAAELTETAKMYNRLLWNHVEDQIKRAALLGNSSVKIQLEKEFNTRENRINISKLIKSYGYITDAHWYGYDEDNYILYLRWDVKQ